MDYTLHGQHCINAEISTFKVYNIYHPRCTWGAIVEIPIDQIRLTSINSFNLNVDNACVKLTIIYNVAEQRLKLLRTPNQQLKVGDFLHLQLFKLFLLWNFYCQFTLWVRVRCVAFHAYLLHLGYFNNHFAQCVTWVQHSEII